MARRRSSAVVVALGAAVAACGAAASPDRRPPTRAEHTPASPVVQRRALGDSVRAERAARRARAAAARRAAGYLTASGRGSAFLHLVHVKPGSTLTWTNSGRFFQVFDQHDVVAVTSVAHAGVAPLPAGRERLKVNAAGRWTIRIRPGR